MRTFVAIVGFVALLIVGVLYYIYSANSIESMVKDPVEESVEEKEPVPQVLQAPQGTSLVAIPKGILDPVANDTPQSQDKEKTSQYNPKSLAVLGTLESKSTARNQLWAGTFQLVWNDFINQLLKGPAQFVGTQPVLADELNKQLFSAEDLSESSYYKKWGPVSLRLKKEIEEGIKAKFNETSGILDQFDWRERAADYFFYAMLKKDFKFTEPFVKVGESPFLGSTRKVQYFGAETYLQKKSVWVLFYNSSNDYAVRLQSKQGDHVYLYRTDKPGTLIQLYRDLKSGILAYQGSNTLDDQDTFKAPMLDFDVTKSFTEITNKAIAPSWRISQAIETIKFKMDEAGVKLKSEAGMMVARGMSTSFPRHFDFNARYVIFLAEKGKKPYFALLVGDAADLQ